MKRHYIVYQITNKVNNHIYIGVHVTENINDKYFGSGSNIKKAIKKFGMVNFEKIILYNFDNESDMLDKERELVNEEFIKRKDTYNIMLGGGFNPENLVAVKDKNGNIFSVHKTDPRYLSGKLTSIVKGKIIVKDKNNNYLSVSINDLRYLSGELTGIAKGKVVVKDKDDNIYYVSVDNHKYLSGELVGITKGTVTVKDKNNNTLRVSINDPRYLSGELVSTSQGVKHSLESRLKTSKTLKGKYTGEKNSQYGTCWIYNEELRESKKIKKEDINNWIEKGWVRGRKIKI